MCATIKQEKAVERVVGNGGNVTQAMRDVGYSENTLNTPQKLTESDGWKELMEQHLPDKDLTKVHKEGLKAGHKLILNGKVIKGVEIPDYAVRHKYLETAYKIKGKLKDTESVKPQEINIIKEQKNIYLVVEKAEEDIKRELEK